MIRLFFLALIVYGLYRLIRLVIIVRRTLLKAKQHQDRMNNRSQKKPFNDVEEADYEVLDD